MSTKKSRIGGISVVVAVVFVAFALVRRPLHGVTAGTATSASPAPAPLSSAREALLAISSAAGARNPIVTGKVVSAALSSDLNVVGSVSYDQDHYAVVGPLVAGRVAQLSVSLGDTVKAGQVLAVIESPEVGQAQAAYLSARARAAAAQTNAT